MSIIGEAILSVSIEMLFKKLARKGIQLFAQHEQIEADLKNWKRMLVKIKAVIVDADEKQTREPVRIWLGELQNLAYDVEDILDEFETEALGRELLNEPDKQPSASASSSKLLKLIPTCCSKFSPGSIKFDSRMASQIGGITRRLQEIVKQKDELELKDNSEGRPKRGRKQPESTSSVIEAEVHGREGDKKAIVELLLKEDWNSDCGVSVIPIIGMGGLGKTTLAQLVYNDKLVKEHFDLKAWACVSEEFDAERVTRTILNKFSPQTNPAINDDLDSLQSKLKAELSGKKFLIVLDDVWNEIYDDWTTLRLPFVEGALGSKIIVTARNKSVADKMGTLPAYELKILSNDDCLLVFTRHSLGTRDFNQHPKLKDMGEEIVKRCNGLPLAAKTLGGLLRGKDDPRDWKNVLKNKTWEEGSHIMGGGGDIMRALRVSYYYLPAHLKRCFAHCALLPKDYEFCEKEIVSLWMAEGLLHSNTSDGEMEELGHDHFQELQSRSFFQQSTTNTSMFVMHDLMNDLAQWAAKDMYFRMEDKQPEFSETLRHFSYSSSNYDSIKRFEALANAKNLRTFLPMRLQGYHEGNLSYDVIHLLMKLQRLRSLSLCGYDIYKIPNVIGDLKHLRYLNLSKTSIVTLPESISTLYNLQTLVLENCYRLKQLCPNMGNLVKLCHLNNSRAYSLEEMPLGISKLTCLKTLSHFAIGKNSDTNSDAGLQGLKSLNNLLGELQISRLENAKESEAKEAELKAKQNLDVLILEWNTRNDGNSKETETETRVLDMLRPHENLKEFIIRGFGGTKFPNWLGNSKFANLVRLRFKQCGKCTSLPSLGHLPVLKHLTVSEMPAIKSIGQDVDNWGSEYTSVLECITVSNCPKLAFLSPQGNLPETLKKLYLHHVSELESIAQRLEHNKCLEIIKIEHCKNFNVLPKDLHKADTLQQLDIVNCPNLVCFPESGLPKKLIKLGIWRCDKLKALSNFIYNLTSLQRLWISNCPSIEPSPAPRDDDGFGFPSNLFYLDIDYNNTLKPLLEWGFQSIREISLSGTGCCDVLSSPPDDTRGMALPTSLKKLRIYEFSNLEHLSSNVGELTSLESLIISNCPKLQYFPENGLPASLLELAVNRCPLMKEKCEKDKGLYWPLIAHLPYVWIDHQSAFDPAA